MTRSDISTPALLLDLDAFEANLARAARESAGAGKKLRPHAKAHKCVEIARRQMAAGATGICVATVAEAELFSKAGISDLLLTSPLADPTKIARVVAAGAMAVVDHPQQVVWYQEAASAANSQMAILIDLDSGDHRTGAENIDDAVEIAIAIDRASHLWLRGVQAYSVAASHEADEDTRHRTSEFAFDLAAEARAEMARHGLHTDITTGGSTGSWTVDLTIPEVTELQAGSYALMDMAYQKLGAEFDRALSVLATVISANHDEFVTVDAGFKAFSTDRPFPPAPVGTHQNGRYRWAGDEFGYLDMGGLSKPRLGQRIEFAAPHCDPTVNLHDRIYACRGDEVEEVWPVMGRFQP
ncbi:MAG TPA: alanine racemase [Bryobacteraceae bacterium]|nr:alanine racemase [Bryobacteraceae bacterium]